MSAPASSPRRIGVIGGGIIGTCSAFFLARLARQRSLNVQITLIEGSDIAAGASGKAGGLLALDWHGQVSLRCVIATLSNCTF